MSHYTRRVHIVPSTLDDEQVRKVFDEVPTDRVYILHNKSPRGMGEVGDIPLDRVKAVVEEKTACYEHDEVYIEKIDFYEYQNALSDVYRIIYREKMNNNEVIVNLSGGTKPVAIALAFACSLADAGQMIYAPTSYEMEKDEGIVVTKGAFRETFLNDTIEPLNITNILPSHENKQNILNWLSSVEEPVGVTELLKEIGEIEASPPKEEGAKKERNRKIQRYHRHAEGLDDDGLLEKTDSKYRLTQTGDLIAELVSISREVQNENS